MKCLHNSCAPNNRYLLCVIKKGYQCNMYTCRKKMKEFKQDDKPLSFAQVPPLSNQKWNLRHGILQHYQHALFVHNDECNQPCTGGSHNWSHVLPKTQKTWKRWIIINCTFHSVRTTNMHVKQYNFISYAFQPLSCYQKGNIHYNHTNQLQYHAYIHNFIPVFKDT